MAMESVATIKRGGAAVETQPGTRRGGAAAAAVAVVAEMQPGSQRGLATAGAVKAEKKTGVPPCTQRGGASAGAVNAEERLRTRGRATDVVAETGVPPGTQQGGVAAVVEAAEALQGARRAGPATVDVESEAPEFTGPPDGAAAVVVGAETRPGSRRGGAAAEAVEAEERPRRRRRYCSRPLPSYRPRLLDVSCSSRVAKVAIPCHGPTLLLGPSLWLPLVVLSSCCTVVLASPSNPCNFEFTSLAAISCSESPISPTGSCCEALIFAIDQKPDSEQDRGLCCLCKYVEKFPRLLFDIAYTYRLCQGKDASRVVPFFASAPVPDCNGPCSHGDDKPQPPPPPPPPPPTPTPTPPSGRKPNKGTNQSSSAIIGIVLGCIAAAGLGVYLCCKCFGPAVKARRSPETSDQSDDSYRGANLEMQPARSSSARNSTSQLL